MSRSSTHLVLLPSYDTGPRLRSVIEGVLAKWSPVIVVDDGSQDGSVDGLRDMAAANPDLTLLKMPSNQGKGAAVLRGLEEAHRLGFTHALVMDADGQHPADHIARFMDESRAHPDAMILGQPEFGPEAPAVRVQGRKLSCVMTRLSTLGPAINDPLFGFRVYPVEPLLRVLGSRSGGRGYDFDTEAAIRLFWSGVPPINLSAPVQYFTKDQGGVSHFHYLRDNAVLVGMHARLLLELACVRFPAALRTRRRLKKLVTVTALVAAALVPGLKGQTPVNIASATNALDAQSLDPFWIGLGLSFATQGNAWSDFTEHRYFPFHTQPVELKGEVRVDPERGLSLHYLHPNDVTVIVDADGVLMRGNGKTSAPPADPRAAGANAAMLDILRLNVADLQKNYLVYGNHDGSGWELELVARSSASTWSIGTIFVMGSGAWVKRIDLRHSEKQRIEITMTHPRPPAPFSAEVLKRYFR